MGKNNKPGNNASKGSAGNSGSAPQKPKKPPAKKSGSSTWIQLGALGAVVVAVGAVGLQFAGVLPGSAQNQSGAAPKISAADAAAAKPVPEPPKPRKKERARKASGPIDPGCVDSNPSCEQWARSGECFKNEAFMRSNCRASCHECNGGKPKPKKLGGCEDTNDNCATWAAIGECDSNPGYMLEQCPVTCKMCQSDTCFDERKDCADRCKGGVESNYSATLKCYYEPQLLDECAWTCGACKEHRFSKPQCKRAAGAKAAAVPGSVDKIFSSIAEHEGATVLSREPWVITIDNFLTSAESDAIIAAGSNSGTDWGRSMAGDGVQASRTSSTAWCQGRCLADPTVQAVEKRVSDLLGGIPMENAEPMQVLRYEEGQFYKTHHDQNSPRASAWGPRMFTVFMYVGEGYTGGETNFPKLNLTVGAKKGAACIWTSVLDSDPFQRDDRTDHQSLPVESGIKYGVNYWVHMYPFRGKSQYGCGNQAYIENWY